MRASLLLAPRPDRTSARAAPGLAVAGELERASGLGEAARLILRGLEHLGIECWAVRPGGALPPAGAPLLVVGNAPSIALDLLRLGRRIVRGRRVIGYWFWELPSVPRSWWAGMRFVDEVWAPSRFTAEALAPLAGTVRVVPLPLALRSPAPSGRTRAEFGLAAEAFVTLVMFNLASSFERKNPLGAIAAHAEAFGGRADRVLFIHVTNPHHFPDDFARLQAACGPNVRLHTQELSRADTEALMVACDVVLSLHRSEGFGLVPAEAMLLGKPVVATDWSSTSEFLDAENAALVPVRLVPARDPRGVFEAPGAVWAEPDAAAAAAWLRRLADDAGLRTRLGAAGQLSAQERFGAGGLADAIGAWG